jgi:6-phosphogluconolactonase (cycloisomerase 2 family)
LLGDAQREQRHRQLHARYKKDDNAAEVAIPAARRRYPAANHAAEALVIYDLQRDGDRDTSLQLSSQTNAD